MSKKVKEGEEVLMVLLPDKNHETVLSMDEDDEPGDNCGATGQDRSKNKQNSAKGNQMKRHHHSSKKTAMHLAAEVGNAERLKQLIETNPQDTGSQDEVCQTPLHLAAKGLHYDCCQILLQASSKQINLKDKSSNTPLMLSISSGNISFKTTELLFSYGAKLNVENKGKWTPFHIAAEKGNAETLDLFLQADKSFLENTDTQKQTPLHLASRNGHVKACNVLLSAGANSQAKDKSGHTPLHLAAKMGFLECIKAVIGSRCEVNCFDNSGNTPLHLLCASGKDRPECLEELLSNGANFNAQNSRGETPFHLAQYSSFNIRKAFQNLPLNLLLTDNKGRTVLHCAAERSKTSVRIDFILSMDQLRQIETEKFVNMLDKNGNTALHIAIMNGEIETCRSLVKARADGNIKCDSQGTGLHLAAERGFDKICDFLIAKRVNINSKNNRSMTPLHLAAKNGHKKCCEILMKRGAVIAETDAYDNTVLHHAAEGSHPECCKLFMDSTVPLFNKVNKDGKTPLHVAVERQSLTCCKILVTKKTDLWSSNGISSPVKLANDMGCKEIFSYLLENCSLNNIQHGQKDIDFRELMKNSLQPKDRETIEGIVHSCYWEESLQPYDKVEQCKNDNLKSLARNYPLLAKEIFDRCLPDKDDCPTVNYKGNPPRRYKMFYIDEMSVKPDITNEETPNKKEVTFKYEKFFDPYCGRLLKSVKALHVNKTWRKNHLLSCIIRDKNFNLLTHPLIIKWIKYKWHCYIRWIHYFFVLLAFVVAGLLTAIPLTAWSWKSFNEAWNINQSAVCTEGKPLVGPEVFPFLLKDAKVPDTIAYVIYGVLSFWFLHDIYKLIMLDKRYFCKDAFAFIITTVTGFIFLLNFTKCSQLTHVREDWQWIVGYISIISSWILVYYLLRTHPARTPIFGHGNLSVAVKKAFIPEIPIIIAVIAIYAMIPQGNSALKHLLETFKHLYGDLLSLSALIGVILILIVVIRMFMNRNNGENPFHNEQQIAVAICNILDYELLYPFLRKAFYKAWLTVDDEQNVAGCLTFADCCHVKHNEERSSLTQSVSPLSTGNMDEMVIMLRSMQADLEEIKKWMANK